MGGVRGGGWKEERKRRGGERGCRGPRQGEGEEKELVFGKLCKKPLSLCQKVCHWQT